MNSETLQKVTAIMQEISNEADKSVHDPKKMYNLLHSAYNTISLLLTHVGYLETKVENIESELQRLSSIVKY